ncbi:adrenocorticotropic hormone receptor-like [Lytechinus pictus]|uniref:adrenocorticotropic hormone receptor-like n=1 Tax=Lytechinus pictus TaxID=7653 RepID=UPI0030B9C12B
MADPLRTYIYHAAMLVFSSLGTLSNLATVCAILLNKALRKEQHIFTFNMALADCISAVSMFIFNLYEIPEDLFEIGEDSWIESLGTTGLLISILSTLAIAFERLIILRIDALGSRRIVTARRSIAVCVVVWIVVPVIYFLILGFNLFNSPISEALGNVVFSCIILSSLLITAICYILIYKNITTISENVGLNDAALQRRAKNSKKVLVTFALVVASTSVCWIIMCCIVFVDYILYVYYHQDHRETLWFLVLFEIANVLIIINAILNPVIIWLRLTDFRAQLRACFERLGCRKTHESQNSSHVTLNLATTTTNRSVSTTNIVMHDIRVN